jgi:hypothetical protein
MKHSCEPKGTSGTIPWRATGLDDPTLYPYSSVHSGFELDPAPHGLKTGTINVNGMAEAIP